MKECRNKYLSEDKAGIRKLVFLICSLTIKIILELEDNLLSKDIKIVGLYDPQENGLSIDMWSNSDGDKLKNLFENIENINFRNDASEIMNVSF